MFVARDARGELVNVLEDKLEKQAYTCPACGGQIHLRQGPSVRTHFAHKSLKDCDFFFENESPEHLANKESLYHWLKKETKVQLEYPLSELKQIADVFVNGNLALEVQCSPLPQKVLKERSEGYRSQGYQVLWLLGQKLWLKERLTRLQQGFLYFSQNMGFYVWELDKEKQVLRLKYLIYQDLRGKLHYQIKEFSYGQGSLLEILRLPYKRQKISHFTVSEDKDICRYIRQQLYYQNLFWMKEQAEAYQKGENILTYGLKEWYPQIRPIVGKFFQIEQDLTSYYQHFYTYYQKNPQNDWQKLYPPAFYQQYFLKNMVEWKGWRNLMVLQRNEINEKDTWDLSTIYPTDQAWEEALKDLTEQLETVAQYEGHLLDSADNLLEITEFSLEMERQIEKLYVYAHMKNDQDTREAKYQEYYAKAMTLYSQLDQAFSFYEPEFMEISEKQYADFLEAQPKLQVYQHYFDKLLQGKDHVLSQREEELLAGAGEIFGSASETFAILDNADIVFPYVLDDDGKEVQLSHGTYTRLMESKKREVRRGAYQALYATYEQFQHTYAKTLQTNVKVQNYRAKVRNYKSARHAALAANFVPESVYDNLVAAVRKHLPLLHRYLELRSKILGISDLKMYDVYTPLSSVEYSFTYQEALKKAEDALAVLGEDYLSRVKRAFSERWIDVYENQGKRSGAYSGGSYDTNAFMLLNWQDNLDNLFTLVHETGHSMHSSYTRETQPYVYGDYSIFLAEIASTTNENILTEKLLEEVEDDATRFAILNNFLDGFRGTVFRQTQFAEFEHAIHQADQNGEVLTSDFLNKLYADLNQEYYGLSKEDNPEIQYEWARIPHFYYNYYVYQYSTGFAAASALAEKIVHGSQEDRDRYIDYLKAGKSDYPLNVMRKAGVDMEKEDYLNDAFAVFERRLNEFEALVEKLGLA
ncbi:oligoendopeptidase F [Streptococcus pneumoniae]|nr:oligoendopeptidase F [Streptococcus pneumoniae]VRK69360.1 oligoendopeptidase F [Streptococcus pneumoniae]VRO42874.1 oligoendopeptidase F [Streptococcus pneumoniae]